MIKISHGIKMDFRSRIYRHRGRYLKKAAYMLCCGAGVNKTAHKSKLGLRRTNILIKLIKANNYA